MRNADDVLFDHLRRTNEDFAALVGSVGPERWTAPTPCPDWDVRALVGHLVQANVIYRMLLRGGSSDQFLIVREQNALGDDPVGSFRSAAEECLAAFAEPGSLDRDVDYPFGPADGRKLLGLLIADTVVHTWDLARATGAPDELDPQLVDWVDDNFEQLYTGVAEGPLDPSTTRHFAAPAPGVPGETRQDRMLRLVGRTP
ncbi:TIGR03086 family protein [Saccharopolyspora hirsuta]|uniref:TIGR03086 family protein n=1 Tax=Saccharopolyspora hirsuta TaxID=1837 RepID=A0A5M7BIX5_SACHI|nr:TIGR03086 family metal-binding protein [Saccharopolyspora hirsuta]KAA5827075.1 TIGR03086 family protein [Saccharopolyspora hirsuta]